MKTKFNESVMDQIRALAGTKSASAIAEELGLSLSSLKTRCSEQGISLRRKKQPSNVIPFPRPKIVRPCDSGE